MKRIMYFNNGDKLDLSNYVEGNISTNKVLTVQKYLKNGTEIGVILNNVLYVKESKE